eukprot:TRINITY_DN2360_c0_g1_i2.p2 TRINITY_DN2360_c0_g1~~TRINITY_DN2360_c0_g1_i2.p2  ORF type:complete len:109 (-),score=13.96 TRINITY_DN2360_c0_g1_i2:160-486(-)
MVRIRGDGRTYIVNMRTKSLFPQEDVFQCFLQQRENEWTNVLIPMDRFMLTWRGFVRGQSELQADAVDVIGIMLADRKEGPFSLAIESVKAVQIEHIPRGTPLLTYES